MSKITTELLGIIDHIREARLLNKLEEGQTSGILSNSSSTYGAPVTFASARDEIGLRLQGIRSLPNIIKQLTENGPHGSGLNLGQTLDQNRILARNERSHPLDICFAAIDGIFRLKSELGNEGKIDNGFFPHLERSLKELVQGQTANLTKTWIDLGRDKAETFKLEGDQRQTTDEDWDKLVSALHTPN